MPKHLYPDGAAFLRTFLHDPAVAPHLARVQAYHPPTYRHMVRVARLALDLGIENRLTSHELLVLGLGALLHDVGKVKTPIGVLAKQGPLDEWERGIIDDHPRQGYVILTDFQPEGVRDIVVGHHECQPHPYPRSGTDRRQWPRWQERRHPDRTIVELTQIVAAADLFDALDSAREYKPKLPLPQIVEIMNAQYLGNRLFRDQVLKRAA